MINNYHYTFMLGDQAFQSDLTCKTCIQSSTVMSQDAMQFILNINRRPSSRIASAHTESFGGQKTKTDPLLQYRSQIAVFYPEIIMVANNYNSVPSSHQSGWGGKFNWQF